MFEEGAEDRFPGDNVGQQHLMKKHKLSKEEPGTLRFCLREKKAYKILT